MTINDIYTLSPGSRVLALCPEKAREALVENLCASMPRSFKTGTELNEFSVVSMDITLSIHPIDANSFKDLNTLCEKLIIAAGRRSHFRGLLLLDLSGFAGNYSANTRLKALGELLAMPDGLASECVTFIYGPKREEDLLNCADCLDFDGRLAIIDCSVPGKRGLDELLADAGFTCDNDARQLLEDTISQMADCAEFSASKFLRSCGNSEGVITAARIDELKNDPWSYINRVRKRTVSHGVGFSIDR